MTFSLFGFNFKKNLVTRDGGDEVGATGGGASSDPPARSLWNVVIEMLQVNGRAVYCISFQRRGSAVYHLYRHYRSREEVDRDYEKLQQDLSLPEPEFRSKYQLDAQL